MDFVFTIYHHEAFDHLKFQILDEWVVSRNGLETVFSNIDASLPELHFQTLRKTEKYMSTREFYRFLEKEDQPGVFSPAEEFHCKNFSAIRYEYLEKEFPDTYVYGLIIDVEEGILWYYLKAPSLLPQPYEAIRQRICETLEFK